MKIEGTILFTEIGPSIFIFIGRMPVKRVTLDFGWSIYGRKVSCQPPYFSLKVSMQKNNFLSYSFFFIRVSIYEKTSVRYSESILWVSIKKKVCSRY